MTHSAHVTRTDDGLTAMRVISWILGLALLVAAPLAFVGWRPLLYPFPDSTGWVRLRDGDLRAVVPKEHTWLYGPDVLVFDRAEDTGALDVRPGHHPLEEKTLHAQWRLRDPEGHEKETQVEFAFEPQLEKGLTVGSDELAEYVRRHYPDGNVTVVVDFNYNRVLRIGDWALVRRLQIGWFGGKWQR